eukprot:COSAG05_NODE_20_length_33177_cov_336.302639_8_plen_65_part_00
MCVVWQRALEAVAKSHGKMVSAINEADEKNKVSESSSLQVHRFNFPTSRVLTAFVCSLCMLRGR